MPSDLRLTDGAGLFVICDRCHIDSHRQLDGIQARFVSWSGQWHEGLVEGPIGPEWLPSGTA